MPQAQAEIPVEKVSRSSTGITSLKNMTRRKLTS
jgi:hypothetical protein